MATYLVGMALIGILATACLRDRRGIDLVDVDDQAEREQGATIWARPVAALAQAQAPSR